MYKCTIIFSGRHGRVLRFKSAPFSLRYGFALRAYGLSASTPGAIAVTFEICVK